MNIQVYFILLSLSLLQYRTFQFLMNENQYANVFVVRKWFYKLIKIFTEKDIKSTKIYSRFIFTKVKFFLEPAIHFLLTFLFTAF